MYIVFNPEVETCQVQKKTTANPQKTSKKNEDDIVGMCLWCLSYGFCSGIKSVGSWLPLF